MKSQKKSFHILIIIALLAFIAVISLVFGFRGHSTLFSASVAGAPIKGSTGQPLVINFAQFLDWSHDLIPGLSPNIWSRGTVASPLTKFYVQYSLSSAFPLTSTTNVQIPPSYISISNGGYEFDVPAGAHLITLQPEKTYYMRLMAQDATTRTYSTATQLISPTNCMVEVIPSPALYEMGGLRGGTQTVASFTVKNNCNESVQFVKSEFSIRGLQVSMPNNNNPVTNVKIFSGTTLLSQPASSWSWYDFKNTIIPANGTKTFTIKADVPNSVMAGDYLLTRIEIRGKTPGFQTGDKSPSALFINTRGFSPSATIGHSSYWQQQY
jgi:hypothetical protein